MAKAILAALVLGVVAGFAASAIWGMRAGVGVAVLVALVGAVVAVLLRNQEDLDDLERGRVAEEVNAALGEEDE